MPAAIAAPAIMGAISAGGSIGSGLIGSNAAKDAAAAQAAAGNKAALNTKALTDAAASYAKDGYNTDTANLSPYLNAGGVGLDALTKGMAPGGAFSANMTADNFRSLDPGYDFRMQQGQQALQRASAATGSLGSGGTLKALARYGQDYASGEFGNAYSRFEANKNANFSRALSLADMGMNAANGISASGRSAAGVNANLAQSAAHDMGEDFTGVGNAQAAGIMGSANSLASMTSGIANATSSTFGRIAQHEGWTK